MLQRIGRYEILDRIAAGGRGTVYRARDTVLDRVVAVRVINRAVANDYGEYHSQSLFLILQAAVTPS